MMYPQMGQMFPGFAATGYQHFPVNSWPQNQHPQFQFPYLAPPQCAPMPYSQGFPQPVVSGGGTASGSGQTGSSKNKKKQRNDAGKQALKADAGPSDTHKSLPSTE